MDTEVKVKHECPCGVSDTRTVRKVRNALVMQLGRLGTRERDRSPAITIHVCDSCLRNLSTPVGKKVRERITEVLAVQFRDVRTKESLHGAA